MQPLVSVGVPTFNRPEKLKKALEALINQSYRNIEIIISDNCSDNTLVTEVIEDYKARDKRITSYSQRQNIGILNNFKFVLEKASGSYFMWAADDDERVETNIEELVSIIGSYSGAFSNYAIKYEKSGKIEHIRINNSAKGPDKYIQAINFLRERIPSMFYGLYRTEDIRWFIGTKNSFDWFDCYLILKIILLYDGFAFSDLELYTAGVQGTDYEYKPMSPNSKRIFDYGPYFYNSAKVILKARIGIRQKFKLLQSLVEVNFNSFLKTETTRKNYKFYLFLHRVIRWFKPIRKSN